ncbi:MAG: DUF1844 domain-containing protein [Planctomycetota bacterium]|jgi:hypothetical protein
MEDQDSAEQQEAGFHVDEDWKKAIAEEKQRLQEQEESTRPAGAPEEMKGASYPGPSIQALMAGLYTQTLVALGELENPVTGKQQKNVGEGAYLIDTIAMLQEKTKGNLTDEESAYIQNLLTDLRMRYVRLSEQPQEQQANEQQQ